MRTSNETSRRLHVLWHGALVVLTTVAFALAVFANPPADEWFYVQIRDMDWLSAVEGFDVLRTFPVVLTLVAVSVLVTGWRCRAITVALVATVAGVWLVAAVLPFLAARPRPFDSALTSEDSFPNPAVAVLTVLAFLVPVALRVAGRHHLLAVAAGILLWAIVLVAGVEEVYSALRWPLDVVGAILIGLTGSVAALGVVQHPSRLHAGCRDCPWQHGRATAAPEVEDHGGPRHPLYKAAVTWAVLLVAVLGVVAYQRGVPRSPESGVMGHRLEAPINIALLLLILVGVAVAARWHLTGAVVVAIAAMLLGYMSSLQYASWVAALVATLGFVPALLLWLQWHRAATVRASVVLSMVMAGALGTLVYFAASTYSTYWGPTHAMSATPAPEDDRVQWMWAGAVTDSGFHVKARTDRSYDAVRLAVDNRPEMTDPTYAGPVPSRSDRQNVVGLTVKDLDPNRVYYYALEVDGTLVTERMQEVSTFPRGPASFSFAVSSCSRTGSNGLVYDAIRMQRPLFFLNYGDWFYGDVETDEADLFRRQYEANLTSPAQARLYGSTGFAYVWDDHDSTGNDADRRTTGWPAVQSVYRQWVPHYPLSTAEDGPIYQAFTVGDVRFILTDPRSQRVATGPEDEQTMLGGRQRKWLIDQFSDASRYGLVVWANGAPWVGKADPTNDTWAGFATERTAISNAIAEYDVDNLLMVSGDAHMLAYDDGTHTDYSDSGEAGFPLFQAASLDRIGSVKGGPYTEKPIPGGGQFGIVTVEDDGETVTVTMTAKNYEDEVLFEHTFESTRDDAGSGRR